MVLIVRVVVSRCRQDRRFEWILFHDLLMTVMRVLCVKKVAGSARD